MHARRDPLLLIAATAVTGLALLALLESLTWVGQTFPGFLILENRVVPSAGLSRWPATHGGMIYQSEVLEYDGKPLDDVNDLLSYVAERGVGQPISYRLNRKGRTFDRVIETRRFDNADYALLFGALLLNGVALAATAIMIRYLRGNDRLAHGSFAMLLLAALFATSAVDLYGPYRLFRLHALCETFLFAGILHMAFVFPKTSRLVEGRPWIIKAPYIAATPLALVNQLGLQDPEIYRATHQLATSAFGLALVVLIGTQLRWYLWPPTFEVRQRVKVVAFGAAVSLSIPAVLVLGSTLTGGATPQNAISFTAIFYPISIGYAAIRHNLLEVDVFLRRTLNYAVLTALATLGYAGSIHAFETLFSSSPAFHIESFGFFATVVLLVLLLPLRDGIQTGIDRVFFRNAYDFRRIVESASARIASVADLHAITQELSAAIHEALHPDRMTFYVRKDGEIRKFQPFPNTLGNAELEASIVTVIGNESSPLDRANGGLIVPFRSDGELVAVLMLARPRSGRIYDGDDRRLLQTLANHGAVAIENALALERLRELNRNLEDKVDERTRELKEAHAQLLHGEKMASLGQFVAGIAHELNNPLNFIQGNLYCLREYVDVLRATLSSYESVALEAVEAPQQRVQEIRKTNDLDELLVDVDSAFDGCAEGIDRSTSLVNDLRTFSRLDQPDRSTHDLHAGIDSALNLLRSQLTGVNVSRQYGDIPAIECLAGQLNQVFVNILANAADALSGSGSLTIRTEAIGDARVCVEVSDTGPGIPSELLDNLFDPFFTTKEVGKGTGLGLSISYGIVTRHQGAITVRSQEGKGTTFRVELPIQSRPDSEARRSRDL
jgi:signal transduction histidine kinase